MQANERFTTADDAALRPEQPVLERLRSGKAVYSLGLRNARTTDIIRMARTAGYDVVWIDLEHSSMSTDCATQLAALAGDLGLEAWVRVPEREYGMIGPLLDGGVSGIIMPRVETVDEARSLINATRFPPRGQRSQIALLPQNGFRRFPPAELMRRAEGATSVHVLLETAAGIANVEALAQLDGIDAVHIGLNDLSVDLGHVGDLRHAAIQTACADVVRATRRWGKIAVVGGVSVPSHYQELIELGVAPLIFAAIDTDVLATGLTQRLHDWHTGIARQ